MPKAKLRDWAQVPVEERGQIPQLHRATVTDQERHARLTKYQPLQSGVLTRQAVEATALLVEQMTFTDLKTDRRRMQRLVKLAEHELTLRGDVSWQAALTDENIDRFCRAQEHMTKGSQNTYRSHLRSDATVLGWRPKATYKSNRPHATTAYSKRDRRQLLLDANHMSPTFARNYRLAYALSFGAGSRPDEMARLSWQMITPFKDGAIVTLANANGVVREVPVGPLLAATLLEAKGAEGDFVFRPQRVSRADVVGKALSARQPNGCRKSELKLRTARNTFILDLLAKPIPFVTVAYVSDLNPGGSVAQDLLSWAGAAPSPAEHASRVWGELR